MFTFFLLSLALVVSALVGVLQSYAAKNVPWHARLTTFYAWLCATIIIVLMPLDIWAVRWQQFLFAISCAYSPPALEALTASSRAREPIGSSHSRRRRGEAERRGGGSAARRRARDSLARTSIRFAPSQCCPLPSHLLDLADAGEEVVPHHPGSVESALLEHAGSHLVRSPRPPLFFPACAVAIGFCDTQGF